MAHEAGSTEQSPATQAEVEALLAKVAEEVRKLSRRRRLLPLYFVAAFALMRLIGRYFSIGGFAGPMMGSLLAGAWAVSQEQKAALRLLAEQDDVRAIGFLVEATVLRGDLELRQASVNALIRLLPRLQASDANLLNAKQRDILRNLASSNSSTPLRVAILKAWEQVGDTSDLATVEDLARSPFVLNEATKAAQECLPFLRQRVEGQRQSATLLRASAASDMTTAPGELLRPAGTGNETPNEQLLRAALTPGAS